LVTGASDGIGREYAIDLARNGFNVAIASRSEDKLIKVAKECEQVNPKS
jgi:17beta-estradiol 17-dehydrogenase / very-long-chain 3-oxoacyl-CoA reductase